MLRAENGHTQNCPLVRQRVKSDCYRVAGKLLMVIYVTPHFENFTARGEGVLELREGIRRRGENVVIKFARQWKTLIILSSFTEKKEKNSQP